MKIHMYSNLLNLINYMEKLKKNMKLILVQHHHHKTFSINNIYLNNLKIKNLIYHKTKHKI